MSSNSFGEIFRITTWGESHGKAIGVVIDGCPAGLSINETIINQELEQRAPGRNPHTSQRKEPDRGEILSGVFEGVTTGTPLSILIWNRDADSTKYDPVKNVLRPGHANYGYLKKYGVFDYRGGGRASARETACRVAAGAVAKQLLKHYDIDIVAYVKQVAHLIADVIPEEIASLKQATKESAVFCPDPMAEPAIVAAITEAKEAGDSLGGIVEFQIHGVPAGLGDPIYQKLDSQLASAMMSLPAAKGVELGSGFDAVTMAGSEHNDLFIAKAQRMMTETNWAGGVLGGISNGMPIVGTVAFKPTSSIMNPQRSIDTEGHVIEFHLPQGSRHDPCVALRAPAIVEAMAALVIADALLMNRSAKHGD